MMLAADVTTGDTRRFVVGPNGCEITGVIATPDMRTMLIDIQHPGETAERAFRPRQPQGRFRVARRRGWRATALATIVIRRKDGGIVGT